MGEAFGYRKIKKSRKPHRCFWCGEMIEVGSSYDQWTWADDRIEKIKCHTECKEDWDEAAKECGGIYETFPYENERPKLTTSVS